MCVCEQRHPTLVNNAAPEHIIKNNFQSTKRSTGYRDIALVDPS